MRFTRYPILPYVVNIEEFEDIIVDATTPEELLSESFYGKLFQFITPGDELVCVILRSNDLSYKEIAFAIGKKKEEVEAIIYKIRKRLEKHYLPLRKVKGDLLTRSRYPN